MRTQNELSCKIQESTLLLRINVLYIGRFWTTTEILTMHVANIR